MQARVALEPARCPEKWQNGLYVVKGNGFDCLKEDADALGEVGAVAVLPGMTARA